MEPTKANRVITLKRVINKFLIYRSIFWKTTEDIPEVTPREPTSRTLRKKNHRELVEKSWRDPQRLLLEKLPDMLNFWWKKNPKGPSIDISRSRFKFIWLFQVIKYMQFFFNTNLLWYVIFVYLQRRPFWDWCLLPYMQSPQPLGLSLLDFAHLFSDGYFYKSVTTEHSITIIKNRAAKLTTLTHTHPHPSMMMIWCV